MKCKVCDGETKYRFTQKLLKKYDVEYFQCEQCEFIQTEKPYWLKEAYSTAIANLDLGLIYRNLILAPKVDLLIQLFFNTNSKFLDYGGGYGMMVRMMRDKGYDFYRQDNYCENLFAQNFDIKDFPADFKNFELVTAFEVFEHLEKPAEDIAAISLYSKNILFSTEILPDKNVRPESWWYFAPETGQHISLYAEKSLQVLAKQLKVHYYKISNGLHLFSEKPLSLNKFFRIEKNRLYRWWFYKYAYHSKPSLLFSDINAVAGRNLFN
jgi:2-polyprenyl-3-methyl-5-hydroxy-6-metoxy-1,4-benzoquinol methylase